MKLGNFGDDGGYWAGGARSGVDDLPVVEQRLLWALRRLALLQPLGRARCHAVHIALQQEFGDAGQGLEHLLRCWLVGLARWAPRRLAIGAPACPLLTDDEAQLLLALRLVADDGTAAHGALVPLAGRDGAKRLLALLAAIDTLVKNSAQSLLSKCV